MMSLRSEEVVVRDLLARLCPDTVVVPWETCKCTPPFDFCLCRQGVPYGALEVTTSTITHRKHNLESMRYRQKQLIFPSSVLKRQWHLVTGEYVSLKVNMRKAEIRKYESILANLERNGIYDVGRKAGDSTDDEEKLLELLSAIGEGDGAEFGFAVSDDKGIPGIHFNTTFMAGGGSPAALAKSMEEIALRDDNRRKLVNSGLSERHLVVVIDARTDISSHRTATMEHFCVADFTFPIPDEITTFWLVVPPRSEGSYVGDYRVMRFQNRDGQAFNDLDQYVSA